MQIRKTILKILPSRDTYYYILKYDFRLFCMHINHVEQNWDNAMYIMFCYQIFKTYYVVIIFPSQEIRM